MRIAVPGVKFQMFTFKVYTGKRFFNARMSRFPAQRHLHNDSGAADPTILSRGPIDAYLTCMNVLAVEQVSIPVLEVSLSSEEILKRIKESGAPVPVFVFRTTS